MTQLTTQQRRTSLAAMSATELDVLVVGGGVTGAGIALDAATRGLQVGVVDAQDWGAGTSSRSSKLVHGGLRYLQMLDFKLVVGGPGRARSADRPAGTAPGPRGALPLPAEPLVRAAVRRRGHRPLRRAGHHRHPQPGRSGAPPREPRRCPADLPRDEARRLPGRDPLLRRPGRRRPPGHRPGPHSGPAGRPRGVPHRAGRARPPTRQVGSGGPCCATWRPVPSTG